MAILLIGFFKITTPFYYIKLDFLTTFLTAVAKGTAIMTPIVVVTSDVLKLVTATAHVFPNISKLLIKYPISDTNPPTINPAILYLKLFPSLPLANDIFPATYPVNPFTIKVGIVHATKSLNKSKSAHPIPRLGQHLFQ